VKGKKSREIASLTKIMTCYVICNIISGNNNSRGKITDSVTVSKAAASMIGKYSSLVVDYWK